ncbi:MAG: diguanylate cyclase [Devosia sp.]
MTDAAELDQGSRRRGTLVGALIVSLSILVTAWAGIELTRGTGRIAVIWLANAVMLAAVLKRPRSEWPILLAMGYGANVLANLVTGDDVVTAALLSMCNSIEVVLSVTLLSGLTSERDFRRPKPMFLLTLIALGPASFVTAILASSILLVLHGTDFSTVFMTWYAADALGLVTLTPMLLLVGSSDLADLVHPAMRRRLALVTVVLVAALGAVFLQSSMPLLFLAFPAIVFATFMLGFAGASLAVLLTSGVALWTVLHGMGPISLMQDDLRLQLTALQIFTVALALTGTAVAILLGERDLLSAALIQAPDFRFIKNLNSEFVSVNRAVALHAGFKRPSELVGKSDFDLTDTARARLLRSEEREVMNRGDVVTDQAELVPDADGNELWFETSKVALVSRTGRVIGLAGTTRDITNRRAMEVELEQSRDRIALVLSEMADGMAVVSADGYIVLCNEHYRTLFPLTGKYRVPGAFMPKILAASKEMGEQIDFDPSQIMDILHHGGNEEVHLLDGTWLQIRARPGSNGSCTMLVSDITKMKRTEINMRALTAQLGILATTDALTGLLNRRALDEQLDREIARCKRNRVPISLLMIDIDHFKAFNDLYGHPAGDLCLQRVAAALKKVTKRPGDLVTRYGGEEIAIVLPETDEAGALVLAEQLRLAVKGLAIEHEGSDMGTVSVSAGLASLVHDGVANTAKVLIQRADQALYIAKGTGRDKVMGWSNVLREQQTLATGS